MNNRKTIFETLRKRREWDKAHPILCRLKRLKYSIRNAFGYIVRTPRRTKWYFQRAGRGWATCDTWGLDYYLAGVIADSITHLKENKHGGPANLTEDEWDAILEKMILSFKVAQRVGNGDVVYLPSIKFDDKKYDKAKAMTDKSNEEYGETIYEVMTKEEVIEYEEGMNLFIEYFFALWD